MHTQLIFESKQRFVQLLGASSTCKTTKRGPQTNQLPIHSKSGRLAGGDCRCTPLFPHLESVLLHQGFIFSEIYNYEMTSQLIMAETSDPLHLLMLKFPRGAGIDVFFYDCGKIWNLLAAVHINMSCYFSV